MKIVCPKLSPKTCAGARWRRRDPQRFGGYNYEKIHARTRIREKALDMMGEYQSSRTTKLSAVVAQTRAAFAPQTRPPRVLEDTPLRLGGFAAGGHAH